MEFQRIINLSFVGCKGMFLFGPRQTGKSYWLRKKFPHYPYYDLLLSDLFFRFSRSPKALREELLAQKTKNPIIIDEIQKLPQLLDEVHYLMERHRMRFILTGSSARKLKRGGANMLGGRALQKQLYPLVTPEIPNFNLNKILNFGSLPAVYKSKNPKELLKSYIGTYLKEEIQAEGLAKKLPAFSLFLDLAGKTNTELINYSNIASDVGVSSHSIREYYLILEDTFIGKLLTSYKKTKKRKSVSMKKFYFFDIGVVHALTQQWDLKEETPQQGRCFEHFIFNEINAYLNYTGDERKICFWRSKNHYEVDFVIGDNLAVEVKAGEVRARDLKGLKAINEETFFKHKIIVSLKEKRPRLLEEQYLILPYKIFLKKLWAKKFV